MPHETTFRTHGRRLCIGAADPLARAAKRRRPLGASRKALSKTGLSACLTALCGSRWGLAHALRLASAIPARLAAVTMGSRTLCGLHWRLARALRRVSQLRRRFAEHRSASRRGIASQRRVAATCPGASSFGDASHGDTWGHSVNLWASGSVSTGCDPLLFPVYPQISGTFIGVAAYETTPFPFGSSTKVCRTAESAGDRTRSPNGCEARRAAVRTRQSDVRT